VLGRQHVSPNTSYFRTVTAVVKQTAGDAGAENEESGGALPPHRFHVFAHE